MSTGKESLKEGGWTDTDRELGRKETTTGISGNRITQRRWLLISQTPQFTQEWNRFNSPNPTFTDQGRW